MNRCEHGHALGSCSICTSRETMENLDRQLSAGREGRLLIVSTPRYGKTLAMDAVKRAWPKALTPADRAMAGYAAALAAEYSAEVEALPFVVDPMLIPPPCSRCDGVHGDTEIERTICQMRFLSLDSTLPPALDALLEAAAKALEEHHVDAMLHADEQRRES